MSKHLISLATMLILISCKGGGGSSSPGEDVYFTDNLPDPLAGYMWHVKNTGQVNFSAGSSVPGNDINLSTIHNVYRGGTMFTVVSDGRVDLQHEDLANNADMDLSRDYRLPYPYEGGNPSSSDDTDAHGTVIVGIIAAERGNGKGGFGVAPMAPIIGTKVSDRSQNL